MKTITKLFGEVEYEAEDVLNFQRGMYGFEEERRFLLLPFSGGQMFCLQSLETPQLAFILMDPFALDSAYTPVLQETELRELGVNSSEELYYYVTCVAKTPAGDSTINMRCPIVINGDIGSSMQVILDDDRYQMRHKLSEFEGDDGEQEGEQQPC